MAEELSRSNIPIPDPSLLTTAALAREIASLKELLTTKADSYSDLTDEKFIAVWNRFESIQRQFEERDLMSTQLSAANDRAVKAALESAKEAVAKEASSTTKQMDSVKESLEDVKNRQIRAEGSGGGAKELWGFIIGAIGVILALCSFGMLLYNSLHRS